MSGSQRDMLVYLALDRYTVGVSEEGEAFAIEIDGPNLARPLRSGRSMRAELANDFRKKYREVPSSSAVSDALLVLEGQAYESPHQRVALRLANHDGEIALDLGTPDGSCVVVNAGGWRVEEASPVTFGRTKLTAPLPAPEPGGTLDQLRHLLNLSPSHWELLVAWMVATIVLDGKPIPVLYLSGEQGTGKTTVARLIRSTVDPSTAPVMGPPRDITDWVVTASGSRFAVVDNISNIPPWLSDALCRAVTGESLVRRKLYSDSDLAVLAFKGVTVLTAIDAGALRGDLTDRIVAIDLEPIRPTDRTTDEEISEAFADCHPLVLGDLLDLSAQVLKALPDVELDQLPRMADFARVVAAVDHVRGTSALGLYLGQRDRLAVDALESDDVARAILNLADEQGSWIGTAGDLLDAISPDRPSKDWPGSPRAMSARVKRCAPQLRAVGVNISYPRRRNILIEKIDAEPSRPSQPSLAVNPTRPNHDGRGDGPSRQDPQPPPPSLDRSSGHDGRDGHDGPIPSLSTEELHEWERDHPGEIETTADWHR